MAITNYPYRVRNKIYFPRHSQYDGYIHQCDNAGQTFVSSESVVAPTKINMQQNGELHTCDILLTRKVKIYTA